jgi:acyl carrier protein
MNNLESNLKILLMKVFALEEAPADFISLKLGDLEEWDSMGNFNLLLAVEDEFGIRFSVDQMGEIRSVRSILKCLYD